MYNLVDYIDNYSKTSASLWQYYKDEPNDNLIDSESFKYKIKITQKAPADGNTKDVEIIAPLKYLRNFWRTLEMPLINCEVNFILTWPSTCVITNAAVSWKFGHCYFLHNFFDALCGNYYYFGKSFLFLLRENRG